jgi:thymidylate synthase
MNARTSFDYVWLALLRGILYRGTEVAPRNQTTKELLQQTIIIDTRRPVLLNPMRKLHYQFMAAEAYWILTGDDRVSTIAPFNKNISQFSDNGESFFGAYGPKITRQLEYVVRTLVSDKDSRQAGLTIWRENPPQSKDIPCTIAIFFNIRDDKLNCHVFMRSSDAWLGIPYDVFTFSMLTHFVCAKLNICRLSTTIKPGLLHLTAASSHLYGRNFAEAIKCTDSTNQILEQNKTPSEFFHEDPSMCLLNHLYKLRTSKPGNPLRWWEE